MRLSGPRSINNGLIQYGINFREPVAEMIPKFKVAHFKCTNVHLTGSKKCNWPCSVLFDLHVKHICRIKGGKEIIPKDMITSILK